MRFSVIVPTYMEEKYIGRCLEAIADQSYPREKYEIIVSDSNSKDNTINIAKRNAKVLVTDKRGISLGRNLGAKEARGEVLVFIDADVVVDKNFLQIIDDALKEGLIGASGIWYPRDGEFLQRALFHIAVGLMVFLDILGKRFYPAMCVAYVRDAFFKVNGFNEGLGMEEDLDLSRRISRLGKCAVVKAYATVSTRRLHRNTFATVMFHALNTVKYLMGMTPSSYYPKEEEVKNWKDLWKLLKRN